MMRDNFAYINRVWVRPEATAQTAHFGANDLEGTITDGGKLTHSYSNEGEVKMTKHEIISMIKRAGSRRWRGIRSITRWKEQ